MARMERSKVRVTNAQNGKFVEVNSTQTPRNNEVGVYFYAKLNQVGIAQLQAQGHDVTNTDEWEQLIARTFNLPKEGFQCLAPLTPETNKNWEITINGNTWSRKTTKAEMKRDLYQATAPVETPQPMVVTAIPEPQVVSAPRVETPMPAATADTTPTDNMETNIEAAKEYLKSYDVKLVKAALMKKYDEAYADKIIAEATKQEVPQPMVIPKLFDEPVAEQVVAPQPQVVTPQAQPTSFGLF